MILFLSNADSEILSIRGAAEGLPGELGEVHALNPTASSTVPDPSAYKVVLVRLLGGRASWEEGFDEVARRCREAGIPLAAFGGEAIFDAELAAASSVDAAVLEEAFPYLVHGGPANMENLLLMMGDRLLGTALGYRPAREVPLCGFVDEPALEAEETGRPRIAVVFYRAQYVAGNILPIRALCRAIEERGAAAVAFYCYSLRGGAGQEAVAELARLDLDALVVTVWAAGTAGEGGDGWEVGHLADLDVPVIQAIAATSSSADWEESGIGLGPMDAAMSIAIPEFDGRIVTVPFSFKEVVDDGAGIGTPVTAYRPLADRVGRVAGVAVAHARLRRLTPSSTTVALVLSAYPTKRSRLGNAVGLDTPASVLGLLAALRDHGYRVERIPSGGDALMAELAAAMLYDPSAQCRPDADAGRLGSEEYRSWFATLPKQLRDAVVEAWGEPPGEFFLDPEGGSLCYAGLDLGKVFVAIQPPRGFGENPVAVYHSPDLPPTHHYLGFYRWLATGLRADAVVHVGKHGTLEWLPGKGVGLSSSCAPDAALADLPLVYPFVVNDPGEGAQAKRRAHAVIVDHLVPPMTRAGTYDDISRIESLLDEHARLATLDPAKLPALRRQLWDAVVVAEIHRDLGLDALAAREDFGDDGFDHIVGDLDGYLCELKDAQIRGGLHVLGEAPEGDALVDMVLAITRLPQAGLPSLRGYIAEDKGIDLETAGRRAIDTVEDDCRELVTRLAAEGWEARSEDPPVLQWIAERLVPSLRATVAETGAVLRALRGRFVEPGPSGAPTRGMAHVLPTGRNFYTIDPRSVPSPLSFETGTRLADALVERYRREEGRVPTSVGLVVWGTATMRTAGDDIAQALALLGVRPVWEPESGRIRGLEVVEPGELGRPRVGVVLRISGFFRDAFSHLISLFDEAVSLVSACDESGEVNPLAAERRSGGGRGDPRVFGPGPGTYGSGMLPLIESRQWEDDADLAAVYLAWGGYAYRGDGTVTAEPEAVRRRFSQIDVAVKNQDNREHDIFDSDDYFQDHGGMIATIRALTGSDPKAYFGDSADPQRPRVRSLGEEAARVVRSRVLNPVWIGAMRRHGYKGAFEMAATVDYLFGYDATAGIVEDWMYEQVAQRYVADPESRAFFRRSNPQALTSIAERLLEADARGMWAASAQARDDLTAAVLEAEGWQEASGDDPSGSL